MIVKELIDKLQQFDEDKLVLVEDTENVKVGTKTTNTTLTCLTGFEVHGQAACVNLKTLI